MEFFVYLTKNCKVVEKLELSGQKDWEEPRLRLDEELRRKFRSGRANSVEDRWEAKVRGEVKWVSIWEGETGQRQSMKNGDKESVRN